jgi:hypothetical protein
VILHRYDAVVRLISGRQPACGSTTVVAVDGPSGSGKSTFTDGLAAATGARVLRLDDIYPGWHGLAAAPPMVARALGDVAVDRIGSVARWSWVHDRPSTPLRVVPGGLLLLDGVGSGAGVIRPFLSALLWVEASTATRKERALSRDGETYAPFWDVWAEQERLHFRSDGTRHHADLVISTG